MRRFLNYFQSSTRSLKTQLAFYFIPVTVLPVLGISYYATHIFEKSTEERLFRQAESEQSLVVSELEAAEKTISAQIRRYANLDILISAVSSKSPQKITPIISGLRSNGKLRVYTADGDFLAEGVSEPNLHSRVNYISREGLKKVKTQGITVERFFADDGAGLIILGRALLKDGDRLYGILEQETLFGHAQLAEIRSRRQLDVIFVKRDFSTATSSLSIGSQRLVDFSKGLLQSKIVASHAFNPIWLGDVRYASYLYDLPDMTGKTKSWAYLGILLPLTQSDQTSRQLRINIIYITAFLALGFGYLIFVFSNRIVKPIEVLVVAMKRVKTGNVEEIPPNDSSYEIDYLISAFNEMIRNVSAAKRALELKVDELRKANAEIKSTQTTLVQSAKMISLGQIVAGVAHELNNPVAFIYSNMHHLSGYIEKIKEMISAYQALKMEIPVDKRKEVENLEQKLEISFLLNDMGELTQSCLDGANRTKEIVLGLRTFSRMDESSFRPSDLHEGLKSTLRLLSAELKNRITVHQEFGEIPKVECALSQINQVFMNLISNAAQAINGKGSIWIRTYSEEKSVIIEIEDSGMGMSPEVVSQVFVPFFTTKRVGEGTGLGLSIAYGLIQKHNGRIEVESEPGKGTLFRIILPITQRVSEAG
ncbi:MAG: sensor histidine kinase [Proteobacteria bacterium]|nr:sensor histidine kinase [Pseudomonadota bacterium]